MRRLNNLLIVLVHRNSRSFNSLSLAHFIFNPCVFKSIRFQQRQRRIPTHRYPSSKQNPICNRRNRALKVHNHQRKQPNPKLDQHKRRHKLQLPSLQQRKQTSLFMDPWSLPIDQRHNAPCVQRNFQPNTQLASRKQLVKWISSSSIRNIPDYRRSRSKQTISTPNPPTQHNNLLTTPAMEITYENFFTKVFKVFYVGFCFVSLLLCNLTMKYTFTAIRTQKK
jgi:hypothetical protein